MAEELCRRELNGERAIEVESAGIGAVSGQTPSPHAVEVMRELGSDISRLRSKPITAEQVRRADHIFVMTYGHLDSLLLLYPNAADKIFLLREFQPGLSPEEREVDDPIGQSRETYRACRDQIRQAIPHLLEVVRNGKVPAMAGAAGQMTVGLGGDATARILLAEATEVLRREGFATLSLPSNDVAEFPEIAKAAAEAISEGRIQGAVLVGRTGIGLAMAANRFPKVRAAAVDTPEAARKSRERYNANVLCLGADELGASDARACVQAWITSAFASGRFEGRVERLASLAGVGRGEAVGPDLARTDPVVAEAIRQEHRRQSENIELIASENFTSAAVMQAQGSCLTNKYAEGYPGRRWYGGCEHVDVVEQAAIDRAKELFGAEHANVQPHSGAQANTAVYFAFLKPGDKILTMDLAHGGHLTHGHPKNFSGMFYTVRHYGVHAQLLTVQKLLNQHRHARLPEHLVCHHLLDGLRSLGVRSGNHHSLARRQAVRLHDQRATQRLTEADRLLHVAKTAGPSGRNLLTDQQLLAERFAAFQPCPLLVRTEHPDPQGAQTVRQSRTERRLRSDHDKTRLFFRRPSGDSLHIRCGQGKVFPDLRRAGVARGKPDLFEAGILGKGPSESVFPPPVADDQHRVFACHKTYSFPESANLKSSLSTSRLSLFTNS